MIIFLTRNSRRLSTEFKLNVKVFYLQADAGRISFQFVEIMIIMSYCTFLKSMTVTGPNIRIRYTCGTLMIPRKCTIN